METYSLTQTVSKEILKKNQLKPFVDQANHVRTNWFQNKKLESLESEIKMLKDMFKTV